MLVYLPEHEYSPMFKNITIQNSQSDLGPGIRILGLNNDTKTHLEN